MKRILALLMVLFFVTGLCTAEARAKAIKKDISSVIEEFGVDKDSLAISIKNTSNGKVVYSLNEKVLMNPASVQKVLTTPVSVETLGDDYEFITEIYSRGYEDVIRLGADTYLTSKNLTSLVGKLNKETTTKISIDDKAIDNKIWGEGWQWDDDMNILMPRFNSYNLDRNLIKLTLLPTDDKPFEEIYAGIIIQLAISSISKYGAEGETSHSEGGVSRSYDNASNYPLSLTRKIIPLAKGVDI